MTLEGRIAEILGDTPTVLTPLSGGSVGEVYRADFPDGRKVAVKVEQGATPKLDIEGWMLGYLREHSALPVPEVLHASPTLLLMSWVDGGTVYCRKSQDHAAELLAALHGVKAPRFGLECDTLIGGLHQPNTQSVSWVGFFREQRLLAMAEQAHYAGKLPAAVYKRIEAFAGRLGEFIDEPPHPSLLHGDIWTGNVLIKDNNIAAFLDPAIYYGHPEVELAFITLFDTFGDFFFSRYNECRPIAGGFFEDRRDVYNLYPLLVHVRLFGAGYVNGIVRTLASRGF